MDEQPIALSVFAGARATTPAAVDALTWDAFCDEVEALCREESQHTDKRNLPAFGPYRLRDGATRAAANVVAMSDVAAIDVDRDVDLAALRERIRELGVAAIVHGSPSDDPAASARKVRVYVKLDAEHAPSDAGRVRDAVAALLGVQHDPATRNADRIFFCGRLAGTPPRFVERFNGRALELAELPPAPTPASTMTAPTHAAAPTPDVAATAAREQDTRARTAAAAAILTAIGPAHEHDGHKHALCGALGGILRKCGWSRADAAEVIRAWLPADDPTVNVPAGVKWACAAWDKPSEDVSGRGALDGIVGPRVGAVVEAAALLPWRASVGAGIELPQNAEPSADDGEVDGLIFGSLSNDPPRQTFLVNELEWGVGRPYGWLGKSNASKTLTLMQAEVELALGLPVFGRFEGPGRPVRVLRIAYEAFTKASEDYTRLLRGLGRPIDWADVNHWLKFAEGRRYLTDDENANREWLLRVTEPFGGGLVVIDPFASAVRGMDENSASIAMPIAGLESVSKANGVTFIMVHHLGHANDRSRGSSAIEAAFGANAIVSKVDGNGRENHRLVTPRKRNRYGTDAFEVIIHDVAEDGSPWVLTTEKRRKGEVSYAVRVVAKGAPPRTTTGTPTKDERRTERIQAKALKLRDVLADKSGPLVTLSCRAARSLVGCNGNDWVDVLDAAQRLGVRLSTVGRTTQLYYDFPKSDRPAPFRPKRDAYHVIPEPYPR